MFHKFLFQRWLMMILFGFSFNQIYAQAGEMTMVSVCTEKEIVPEDNTRLNFETNDSSAPGTSFYFELMGKGFYSLNVDFRRNKSTAMSLGLQLAENAFIPSFMYYHFRGKTYRFETGGGISGILTREDGLAGMMIHGVLGYRYQKKNGLIFRAGFTPLMGIPLKSSGRFIVAPLVGISLGYSL
ncbi:hypothetical protein JW964_04400 [candidate division KSB1 bacterium]|nr:hypothetical protein [candidate division KSB1 bacterium]